MSQEQDLAVLRRALDQLAELLDGIPSEVQSDATPCADWNVQELVDHVVAAPEKFARMVRGESIDWAALTPSAGSDPAGAFRAHASELLASWRDGDEPKGLANVDWQCAELAVHAWDLATALNRSTGGLDPEVAQRGLIFMEANLTPDNRGPAFGPEQLAPKGADAYQRIAAFAGRAV